MAYSCDVAYPLNGTFIDSSAMCYYIWYHVVMLLLFGSMSFFLLCITLAHWTCNSSNPTQTYNIQLCLRSALMMLALSLGFEIVLLAVYGACFIGLSISIVRFLLLDSPARPPMHPQIVTAAGCPICLDTLDGPMHVTDCGHAFHAVCIRKWEAGTCPLCRDLI
jgi:hypothetical protein